MEIAKRWNEDHIRDAPGAGLMRKLDTVGVNLQDLNDVWMVSTHHV